MNTHNLGRAIGLRACAAGALLALSACGGGGGGGGSPATAVPPASANVNFAVTTEYLSEADATGMNTVNTQSLVVVDLRTGQSVLTLNSKDSDSNYLSWAVSERNEVIDSSSARFKGVSQLFTLDGQRVQQRDLRGSTLGAPATISSLTSVCTIYGSHELNAEGTEGWLEVYTGGADDDCSTSEDNVAKLIPFGANTSEAGTLSGVNGGKGLTWVDALRPNATNPVVGVLAVDRATGLLNVYSTDLSKVLSNVSLGRTIDPSEYVNVVFGVPSSAGRLLVQAGKSLYAATLAGTQLTLGNPVRTLQSGYAIEAVTDGQNAYLADGNALIEVSASGVIRTVATADASKGRISYLLYSGGSLVITQRGATAGETTVTAYAVIGGKPVTLATSTPDVNVWPLFAQDGQVWLEKADKLTRLSELVRMNVDGSNPVTVASKVRFVSSLMPSTFSLNTGTRLTQVLWCEVRSASQDCAGSPLMQFDLSTTAAPVNLGTIPADVGWTANELYDQRYLGRDDQPNLLTLSQGAAEGIGYRSYTLFYVPGQAGSLKKVTAQP